MTPPRGVEDAAPYILGRKPSANRRAGCLHPAVTFRRHPFPGNLQPTPTVGGGVLDAPQLPVTPRPRATNTPPPPKELSHAILPKTALPADPRPGRVVRCGRVRAAVQRFLRAAQPHGRRQRRRPRPGVYAAANRDPRPAAPRHIHRGCCAHGPRDGTGCPRGALAGRHPRLRHAGRAAKPPPWRRRHRDRQDRKFHLRRLRQRPAGRAAARHSLRPDRPLPGQKRRPDALFAAGGRRAGRGVRRHGAAGPPPDPPAGRPDRRRGADRSRGLRPPHRPAHRR